MSIFEQARRGEEQRIVEFIHEHPDRIREVNDQGESLLVCAASGGNTSTVDLICDFAQDLLDLADNDGRTPLHHAVMKDHLCTTKTLIRWGSRSCFSDNEDRTPFATSIFFKANRTFSYLFEINECRVTAESAIHVAVSAGNAHALSHLLCEASPKMCIEMHPVTGETPLHVAVRTNSNSCVALLLKNEHARQATMIRDASGRRPITLALASNNLLLIGMLIRWCKEDRDLLSLPSPLTTGV